MERKKANRIRILHCRRPQTSRSMPTLQPTVRLHKKILQQRRPTLISLQVNTGRKPGAELPRRKTKNNRNVLHTPQ